MKTKKTLKPVFATWKRKNISMVSDIMCSFKSICTVEYTRYIKQNNLNISAKIWQRSFYDHVIRNEYSLNAIREYIADNPVNWETDLDNLINLVQFNPVQEKN